MLYCSALFGAGVILPAAFWCQTISAAFTYIRSDGSLLGGWMTKWLRMYEEVVVWIYSPITSEKIRCGLLLQPHKGNVAVQLINSLVNQCCHLSNWWIFLIKVSTFWIWCNSGLLCFASFCFIYFYSITDLCHFENKLASCESSWDLNRAHNMRLSNVSNGQFLFTWVDTSTDVPACKYSASLRVCN